MIRRKANVLFMLATGLVVMGFSSIAFAQEASQAEMVKLSQGGWIALSAGLTIGLAAIGGALGQGRTAAAALEGIARNPASADRIFTPMILGLALIESLVIYALIIAFLLQGKIG